MHHRVTNVFVEYQGKSITVTELAKLTGIPRNTIYTRLKRGQPWNHCRGSYPDCEAKPPLDILPLKGYNITY